MKFDYVIGNPAYNSDFSSSGDNENYAAPVYNEFLDAAFKVSDVVEMIHPARFLFNAGSTPKKWNAERLDDTHFKVLFYENDSSKVFANTDIKGGVAITYRNSRQNYGAIKVFCPYEEANTILKKVINSENFVGLDSFYNAPECYRFTDELYKQHPEIKEMTYVEKGKTKPLISKGHDYDLSTNILEKLDNIAFFKVQQNADDIKVLGRKNNERIAMYINKKFIKPYKNLGYYKVLLAKSNGNGTFGETLSTPFIGMPEEANTQTFISLGSFNTEEEANNLLCYIKTKFFRCLLSTMKVTQDNKQKVWVNIPVQDFTSNSDIDWSKSIPEIDQQLYHKYGLSEEEINFIETHVKEMN